MPITKIPISHKFGIISHSQRLELQERLLKQTYLQSVQSQKVVVQTSRNPLEVTEEFIKQYNEVKGLEEKQQLETTAQKMLERAKRRAGLRDKGNGQHVNLPMAWTELAQLAQCKGKIQDECLDVLIISLDQSPLEKYHIPALFFLAETMLYWLRTDSVHQPYLRTGEIKLLKMGELTFTRLFYHHMAGQLQGQNEFKSRLFTYLDGLGECQEAYNPYPNALLCLRFIITVGKIIMADAQMEPGEIKEGDIFSKPRTPLSRPSRPLSRDASFVGNESTKADTRDNTSFSAHSGAISSSVHDLSPTLWHALDVWRCTNHLGGGLGEALRALAHCGMGLSNENWIDTMIALKILAEAAKTDIAAMQTLHSLARGSKPKIRGGTPPESSGTDGSADDKDDIYSVSSDGDESHRGDESYLSSKPTLSDIYERSDEDRDSRLTNKLTPDQREAKLSRENLEKFDNKLKSALKENTSTSPVKGPQREVSFADSNGKGKKKEKKYSRESDHVIDPHTRQSKQSDQTGFRVELGSDASGRDSQASSVPTYTNLPMSDTPGLNGWHWEVAITYTDILADICLYGANANIQKMALIGNNKDVTNPVRYHVHNLPLKSSGLLDLAFFHATNEVRDGGPNDWSWRIRYGAIQSLVKIVRCLGADKNKEGMKTAAWNILLKAHSHEKDDRVLEALKVGQVHTDIEQMFEKFASQTQPVMIGSKMAAGLSNIYLPPLPPPVDHFVPKPKASSPPFKFKQDLSPRKTVPNRTSLKEEIMLATALYEPPIDFKKRTSFDLRRIVEDQWRKELQMEMEEEERQRQRDLEAKNKAEEERQRYIAQTRAKKLANNKPSPVLVSSPDM
ncbi:transmembrane protein 232-like isoform X1 [Ylistrum balloti]|uniref:transmembrane protein 232-like isoform X1 n=1 Tax=Ylistrum balloti TaxID=509963 RepID=UPI0029059406|nr:transmembrane protein 232-like isoform X1 [Ylistrum balloti]XP_060065302.1 transmembrane protein 232-like isoform X1 [Ylistrum balloti]